MIGSIGGFDAASYAASAALARKSAASNNTTTTDLGQAVAKKPDAKSNFLEYMKMSPGERMEADWLKSHGLSKEKLAAMSATEREKIMRQMRDEIARSLKEKSEENTKVDVLV